MNRFYEVGGGRLPISGEIQATRSSAWVLDTDAHVLEIWARGELVAVYDAGDGGQAGFAAQSIVYEGAEPELAGIDYFVVGREPGDSAVCDATVTRHDAYALVRRLDPGVWEVWAAGELRGRFERLADARTEVRARRARGTGDTGLAEWLEDSRWFETHGYGPTERLEALIARRTVCLRRNSGEWHLTFKSRIRHMRGQGYEFEHYRRPAEAGLSAQAIVWDVYQAEMDDRLGAHQHVMHSLLETRTWPQLYPRRRLLYTDGAGRVRSAVAEPGLEARLRASGQASSDVAVMPWLAAGEQDDEAAAEFEWLINNGTVRERDLQSFLEDHPGFLVGEEFEWQEPQLTLAPEGAGPLRPDFLLQPLAASLRGEAGARESVIVELKLPQHRVVSQRDGATPLQAIRQAAAQLRRYHEYFEMPEHRDAVRRELGFAPYRPRLILVVGRSAEPLSSVELRQILAGPNAPIELIGYEDLLRRYRELVLRR